MRLDQRFMLRMPDNVSGTIATLASRDKIMSLGYGQHMMELKQEAARTASRKHDEQQTTAANSVDAPMSDSRLRCIHENN